MWRAGRPGAQRGIALVGVLVAVSLLGLLAGIAGTTWKSVMQQAREADLLWTGEQYRQAIGSYYEAAHAPGVAKIYPTSLESLLKDPRFTETRRHLRRLYPDPLTGEDWVVVKDPNGRIKGVRSRSELTPFKQDGFTEEQKDFAGKQTYHEWQFVYQPKTPSGGTTTKAAQGAASGSGTTSGGWPVFQPPTASSPGATTNTGQGAASGSSGGGPVFQPPTAPSSGSTTNTGQGSATGSGTSSGSGPDPEPPAASGNWW